MTEILELILCLLVLCAVIFVLLLSIFFIYSTVFSGFMKRSPFVITTGATYRKMIEEMVLKISQCEKQKDMHPPFSIVDAGCGIATLLLPLAKKFPQHRFVGVEIGFIPYWIAKIRAAKYKNLQIFKKNLFDLDFNQFDFIICFLLPKTMQQLFAECEQQIKHKTVFFVNRFKIEKLNPAKQIDLGDNFSYIYIYEYLPNRQKQRGVK